MKYSKKKMMGKTKNSDSLMPGEITRKKKVKEEGVVTIFIYV